jgi:DNA invertase Pin-like site-specific DNA recombinase
MERAILYTRVSTDEQNNGYSPSDQKDKLYRFCENRNIEIVGFYHDDESGKSFERPEWKKIMEFLKKNKNSVDSIYFIKWDRFSRNAPEAYNELNKLKKFGVEAKAIEQPLDLEIPEQKLMLAIYLTAPEVDNDRRALNIFNGIRRAKKEGRWLGGCPIGYKNKRNEFNKPIIAPEGGEIERLVKEAFKEFSTGLYSTEDLRKKMNEKGLNSSRNSFYNMLRNKVYIGQILVPAYKNEPEVWVKGQHIGIIDKDIFYECQDVIEGRKKKIPQTFVVLRDEFPLRGFLCCSICGKKLTASNSRGRRGVLYPYYHCSKGCAERHKAELVNSSFENLLSEIKFKSKRLDFLAGIIKDKMNEKNVNNRLERERINKEIIKQNNRKENARNLLLDGELNSEEYNEIKALAQKSIENLTRNLNKLSDTIQNINEKIDESMYILSNLKNLYTERDTAVKQRIIGSIFKGNLVFEKNEVRTPEMNKLASLILSTGKGFGDSKKNKHAQKGVLTRGVESEGFEPNIFEILKTLKNNTI